LEKNTTIMMSECILLCLNKNIWFEIFDFSCLQTVGMRWM
jgi:hypothetical protein